MTTIQHYINDEIKGLMRVYAFRNASKGLVDRRFGSDIANFAIGGCLSLPDCLGMIRSHIVT